MSLINVRYLIFANYDPFPRFFASFQNGSKTAFATSKTKQDCLPKKRKTKRK